MMSAAIGCLMWWLLLYPLWSPRCRRIRAEVSRNPASAEIINPAWEQDYPWPECFDSMEGEDDV